jgi:hypothetical protein
MIFYQMSRKVGFHITCHYVQKGIFSSKREEKWGNPTPQFVEKLWGKGKYLRRRVPVQGGIRD